MKIFTKVFFISSAFLISVLSVSPSYSSIIIDHTYTDISQIPDYWINQAKALYRISYGHTSHGSQIVTGMTVVENQYGSLYDFNYSGSGGALSLHDYEPSGDLGNPDRVTWAQRTRDLLNTPGNDRNMIMWSWCGQVSNATETDINTYLNLMNQLEIDYPDVTFIYMTGHLDGTGEGGTLNIRNNQIRTFCSANNKVLFDFADIESYDPDGNYFLNLGANDECDYSGGNWADQWCAAHPGECASCSCAHSRCLNCQLKGKAFWWMMARLAGWEVTSTTTTIDPNDVDGDGVLNAADNCPTTPNPDQFDTRPPGGNGCGDACECESDLDDSGAVDGVDTNLYKADYGRNPYHKRPCTNEDPCLGDFDCSKSVDGVDTNLYKQDYVRNPSNNPCPDCSVYTCVYPSVRR